MKNFTHALLALIALMAFQPCFLIAASADTLYVSTTGYDSATRGSQSRPFKTLAYACNQTEENSGDIIQLESGEFIEQAYSNVKPGVTVRGRGINNTILRGGPELQYTYVPSDSGYFLNRFLIQLISSSVSTGNQQISGLTIDGVNKNLHGGIVVQNRNQVKITNVRIQYTGLAGIWLEGTDGSEVSHSTLTDASFGNSNFQSGNLVLANVEDTNLFGLTIRSYPYNGGTSCGYGVKAMGQSNPFLRRVKFYDSSIDVSKFGTFVDQYAGLLKNISLEYHNATIENCEISNTTVNGNISVVQDNSPSNGVPVIRIYNNVFNLGPEGDADQRGYALELCVNNAEVYHNYFNQGYYAIFKPFTKRQNWKIHHNIFENQRYEYVANTIRMQDYNNAGGVDNLEYYNNTILTDGNVLNEVGQYTTLKAIAVISTTTCTNWKIKNNIVKRTNTRESYQYGGPTLIYLEGASLTSSQVYNNLFDQFPAGTVSGVDYQYNLDNNDAGLQWSGNKPDPYFTLTSTSAAIDAGVDVGFPFNGSKPDIGAYESNLTPPSNAPLDFSTQPSGTGTMNPTVYTNADGGNTTAIFANITRHDGSDSSPAFSDHTATGNNRMVKINSSSATITFTAPVKVPSFFVNTLVYGSNTGWTVVGSLNGVAQFTFTFNYTFAYATWGEVTAGNNKIIDKLTWTNAQNTGVDDITIQSADDQAPTAPTSLAASAISSGSFTLSWSASTDNTAVTQYEIFRGTTSAGTTNGATTYNVTGLSAATTYSMTVKARDVAGNVSVASSALNVTTSSNTGSLIDFTSQGSGIGTMSPTVYNDVDGNGTIATFANINRYDGSDSNPPFIDMTSTGNNRMGKINTSSATITFSAPVKIPSFFVNTLVYGANTGWTVVGSLNGVAQFTFTYNYAFTYATWGEVTSGSNKTIDKLTWTNAQNTGVDDIRVHPAGQSGGRLKTPEAEQLQPDQETVTSFEAFPNPAYDYLHITWAANGDPLTVQLRSVNSSVLKNFSSLDQLEKSAIDLYVGNLNSGIYLLDIQHGKKRYVRKIVINR